MRFVDWVGLIFLTMLLSAVIWLAVENDVRFAECKEKCGLRAMRLIDLECFCAVSNGWVKP